jgi:hypothetical protein
MRIGVLRFPGSNCDDDSLHVVTTVLKEEGQFVWHKETALPRRGRTNAIFAPPSRPPASAGGRRLLAALAASPASAVACHSGPQQGVARPGAVWTGGLGCVRLRTQGFPGARASGRPVGESGGGTISNGISRRKEVKYPAAVDLLT